MSPKPEFPVANLNLNKRIESLDFNAFLMKSRELPSGVPGTYGATPLDRMATLQQQLMLAIELQELTYRNIPDDVPMEIVDYVHTTFATRFHSRAEANEENYMTALHFKDEYAYNQDILGMFTRGELGQASPSELLMIRELRGIRSVELACLTHPYGARINNEQSPGILNDVSLPEMRDAVKQHIELMGGMYFDKPKTEYRVKELVGYARGTKQLDEGLLMTRKRTMGQMPDGTVIKERSSFVLRVDEASPFTRFEREAMHAVDLSSEDWAKQLNEAGKLDEVASVLLEMDEFSFAIPISTTIYAYNLKTGQQIKKRDTQERIKRQALFAKEHPVFGEEHPLLAAAMNSERKPLRVAEDRNGIFFVGPSEYAKGEPDIDFN